MLTILGGRWKGRSLKVPKTARPTSALIRKSLFDIWRQEIDAACFLDLFAGSGAMGIEALSRGATLATFVDINPKAIKLIQQNLENFHEQQRARLIRGSASQALKRFAKIGETFDLIFIDPPYDLNPMPLLESLDNNPLLNSGGIIALETNKKMELESHLQNLIQSDLRIFGDTKVTFYQKK